MSRDVWTDTLSEWLSDGPTEASDLLIGEILRGVSVTTGQRAAGRGRTFGSGGTRLVGGALVAAFIAAAATVAGLMSWEPGKAAPTGRVESAAVAISASPQPTVSPSVVDAAGMGGPWVPYGSRQPAFSAAYPASWRATSDYFRDGRPPIVAFEASNRDAVIFVSIGSGAAGATMPCGPIGGPPDLTRCATVGGRSLDELEQAYGRFIQRCCGANWPDPGSEHIPVDGTRAVLSQSLNDPQLVPGSVRDFTLAAVLLRGGTPIVIVWSSTLKDHEADRTAFIRFLGTIRFGP